MTAPSLAYQLETARSASSPARIDFAPGIREEILAATLTAPPEPYAIPLAGLLMGHHDDGECRVTGWVTLGGFRTHEALESAMKMEAARQKRAGAVCLGWFRSQPMGSSRATPEDLQVFGRVFSKRWQFTLIVRPSYRRPAQLSLYQRDAKGFVRPEQPTQSFMLFPPTQRRSVHPMVTALSQFLDKRYSPWLALGMAVAGLMIGGLTAAQRVNAAGPAPLAIQQSYANWDVTWDRTLGWSPKAHGELTVIEGPSQKSLLRLTASDLRRGSITVPRRGDSVEPEVMIEVKQPDGRMFRERTRLISQVAAAVPVKSRGSRR